MTTHSVAHLNVILHDASTQVWNGLFYARRRVELLDVITHSVAYLNVFRCVAYA